MSISEISLYESQDHNYLVDTTSGRSFISQREAANLLGVDVNIIKRKINNLSEDKKGTLLSENNQLSEDIFADLAIEFAAQGKRKAVKAVSAFARAGIRAFIYSQAGYDPRPAPAAPPEPPPLKQLPKPTGILVRDHMQPRWYTTTETYKTAMANRSLYPDPNTDNTLWIDWETGEVEPPRRLR